MKLSSPESRADASRFSRALILLLAGFLAACVLRLPSREVKIMHTDEATQAVKLHELMEGRYHYDPVDHHGPALLYATRSLLRFTGTDWGSLTESRLRLVPALFGTGLIGLLLLTANGMGRTATGWAALFTAVSPLMVFYSRYYIMETLLVFFTFGLIGCGWRYFMTRRPGWLVPAGVCAGLMHVTKETCVLHFAAMGAALFAVCAAGFFTAGPGMGVVNRTRRSPVRRRHLCLFAGCAAATSILFFSRFFTDWQGVRDSVATYFNMLGRAGGQGHEKPFGYYLDLQWGGVLSGRDLWAGPRSLSWPEWSSILCLTPDPRRAVFTEGAILVLAAAGCLSAFTATPSRHQSKQLARFLAIYGIVTFLIYSLIRYKTPWCIMGAWHALLLMAGLGADAIVRLFRNPWARRTAVTVFVLASAHLALQSWRATRDFARDSRNPYNYSMTSPDVLAWVEKFTHFAALSPEGFGLRLDQSDPNGGWPLPWYLTRKFPNYHWDGQKPMDPEAASVLLLSSAAEAQLKSQLAAAGQTALFESRFVAQQLTLHPSGSLQVYVKKDLWDQYLARQPWPPLAVQQ